MITRSSGKHKVELGNDPVDLLVVVAATPMLAFEAGTVDAVAVAAIAARSETVGVSML